MDKEREMNKTQRVQEGYSNMKSKYQDSHRGATSLQPGSKKNYHNSSRFLPNNVSSTRISQKSYFNQTSQRLNEIINFDRDKGLQKNTSLIQDNSMNLDNDPLFAGHSTFSVDNKHNKSMMLNELRDQSIFESRDKNESAA